MPVLIIDPGHGGHDSGAVKNGVMEKNVVLTIGLHMRNYLAKHYPSIKVYMTRSTDVFVSLSGRTSYANKMRADAFVSIHVNSAANTGANGFETFIFNKGVSANTRLLQKYLHDEIFNTMNRYDVHKDRGLRQANYHVLRESNMPACLTENLFVSNVIDNATLSNTSFLKEVGEAHAKAVGRFFGIAPINLTKPKEPIKETPVAESKPRPEPEEDIMKEKLSDYLNDYQMDQFVTMYREARELDKLITSDKWEKKAKDRSLTFAEAIYLDTIINHRHRRASDK